MSADIKIASAAQWPDRPQAIPEHSAVRSHAQTTDAKPLPVVPKAEVKLDTKEMSQRLDEAIARLNEMLKNSNRNLAFSRDEALNTTVITVKNTNSGEVVRQIPSEVVLRVAHSIDELKGMLHNEKI